MHHTLAYMHACIHTTYYTGFVIEGVFPYSPFLSCRVTLSGISRLLGFFSLLHRVVMMFVFYHWFGSGTANLTSHRRTTPSLTSDSSVLFFSSSLLIQSLILPSSDGIPRLSLSRNVHFCLNLQSSVGLRILLVLVRMDDQPPFPLRSTNNKHNCLCSPRPGGVSSFLQMIDGCQRTADWRTDSPIGWLQWWFLSVSRLWYTPEYGWCWKYSLRPLFHEFFYFYFNNNKWYYYYLWTVIGLVSAVI